MANEPVTGKVAIKEMFEGEFAQADMTCIPINVLCDGEWVTMEWTDSIEMKGCGFFHVIDGKIKLQRGYWDKLSFLKLHDLPIPS